jgi:hypothetical protein
VKAIRAFIAKIIRDHDFMGRKRTLTIGEFTWERFGRYRAYKVERLMEWELISSIGVWQRIEY